VFGDDGDDWIEGGTGQDLLQGDHGAPFFDDPAQVAPGNDIFIGQPGENDYDAEGGDDIMAQNAAIDRNAGAAGFDWAIHQYDTVGADDDMEINNNLIGVAVQQVVNRDRWQETEADSGSAFNDIIKGTNLAPSAVGGAGFVGCDVLDQAGVNRISGLAALLPQPLTGDPAPVAAISVNGTCPTTGPIWGDGDILLGGGGSDTINGRGANDIIDGDRSLAVRISVRTNPALASTETGTTDLMEHIATSGNFGLGTAGMTLQQAVFAGLVDPGNLVAVREILNPAVPTADCGTAVPLNCDTAVFSGVQANYTVTTTPAGARVGAPGSVTTVTDLVGLDGTDTVTNVEVLQFADTATPGAPTAVTAVGGQATATVTWAAPLLGKVAQVVTSFLVEARNGTTGLVRTFPAAAGATTLTMTALAPGSYTFRVQASNAAATPQAGPFSLPSAAVAVTGIIPGAPTIRTATAGNTTATVNWSAPAPNGGSAITGYSVQVQTAAGVLVAPLRLAGPTATSLVVTGLTNGTSYRFRVQATNAAGTGPFSALSNAVTPAVITVPGAPTIGTAVAGNNSASVNWTPPASNGGSAITSFSVQVINPVTGAQIGALQPTTGATAGTATSLTVTGLTNGTSYQFRVRAVNAIGSSIPSGLSNTITATAAAGTAPGAPTIRNAASGAAGGPITATANWRPGAAGSSPITGYIVTAIGVGVPNQVSAVLTPGPVRDQSFEMTLPAGNYRFTVVAINATGTSVASGQSNQVTAR